MAKSLGQREDAVNLHSCTSNPPRKKLKRRKQTETSGQRRKIPNVHTVTRSLYGKENISSFEYWGISFLLNTSILDPISETGLKP